MTDTNLSTLTAELAPTLPRAVAILSLLGDGSTHHAATRKFAGTSVLARTLQRIAACKQVADATIMVWDDQLAAVGEACPNARVRSLGPRKLSPAMLDTEAALRWSDGWRGALLGKTTFDRGFDAAAILAAIDDAECDAALIVDASAAFIEASTLDELVLHLGSLPDQPYAFAPGAVGTGAMLLRRSAVADLLKHGRSPGSLTMYHPDRPTHDPMAKSFAIVVPPKVARSSARLTVDSDRQSNRLSLLQSGVVEAIEALDASRSLDPMPRDVVLEFTTRRATKPVWSMLSAQAVDRPDLSLDQAKAIFDELGRVDDIRLTLAGVGDPLLHPHCFELVRAARDAGIRAIHLETDLLPEDPTAIESLVASGIDIVSFQLPAAHVTTYTRLMGVDRMREALESVKHFLVAKNASKGFAPILVPTFVKCAGNLAEMEVWYDQWIRALGIAVIAPPSDYSGRISYVGVADMTAGRRRPCRRLNSRITILSDGSVASCEEDVLGQQRCGASTSVARAWTDGLAMLRSLHDEHRWDESELCKSCRMWDRP